MNPFISLNEMREQVARMIYGDDWIGGLGDDEYELLREHGPRARAIKRTDGSTINLNHITKCSANPTKLDRAIGRQVRMEAQFITVDSWVQDNGFQVDPRHPADRRRFNAVLRAALKAAKPESAVRKRGTKAEILPRLVAAMSEDIAKERISISDFEALPDKELEARYEGKRERVRTARKQVLADLKKQLRQTPTKNK